jgi:hypothetical protein
MSLWHSQHPLRHWGTRLEQYWARGYLITISFSMVTAILGLYHVSARVVREEVWGGSGKVEENMEAYMDTVPC